MSVIQSLLKRLSMKSDVIPPNLFFIASSTVSEGDGRFRFYACGVSFLGGLCDNFRFSLIDSEESKSF